MNLKILVLASNPQGLPREMRSIFHWGQTHRKMGAESHGSLQVPAAGIVKFLSEKDSRAAACEIVKVTKMQFGFFVDFERASLLILIPLPFREESQFKRGGNHGK